MNRITKIIFSMFLCMLFIPYSLVKGEPCKSYDEKVDIGGYGLHLHVEDNRENNNNITTEEKQLTILFEAGYGDTFDTWNCIQPEISKKFRTVSYDRAGLGKSDNTPLEKTTLNQVHELHTMLQNANIEGPYVIVAHSLGGYNARVFAKEYPNEVAGVLFIDCSHEDQNQKLLEQATAEFKELYMSQFTAEGSYEDVCKSAEQVKSSRDSLRTTPITVITATDHGMDDFESQWKEFQDDIASLSDNSKHLIAEGFGHYVYKEDPQTAINAFNELVERIQADETIYIDHHMHMMSEEFSVFFKKILNNDKYFDTPIKEVSGDSIISLLDEANMDKAFVLSNSYILGMSKTEETDEYEKVKKENNYLSQEVSKHPDRLIGFFSVNPLKDYAIKEIDRCHDVLQLSGLKLHFTNSNIDLNNPEHLKKIKEIFSHCAKKDIPILIHFKSRSREFGKKDAEILIDEVITKTPNLKLQIAHLGGWGGFDKGTNEVLSTFIKKFNANPNLQKDNIFFDISGIVVTDREYTPGELNITSQEDHKKIAEMLREWGLDNIVFGSDYQYNTPKAYIEYLRKSLPLTEEEFENVLDNDLTKIFFQKDK